MAELKVISKRSFGFDSLFLAFLACYRESRRYWGELRDNPANQPNLEVATTDPGFRAQSHVRVISQLRALGLIKRSFPGEEMR